MISQEYVTAFIEEQIRVATRERLVREARRQEQTERSGHGRRPSRRVERLLRRLHVARA